MMWLKAIRQLDKKEAFGFLLILALAAFLRFYRMPDLMPFSGDQGRDFLVAAEMVESGDWPLLGGQSSLARFNHGPVYIWITALIFRVFGFNPEVMGYFAAVVGLLTVGLTYILTRKYFSVRAARLAALVLAASPLAVVHSRMALHINPVPLMALAYWWLLVEFYYGRKKLWWPVLAFGLLFQLELSLAPMILLVIIAAWQKRKRTKIDEYLKAVGVLILSLWPQIIYDLKNNFEKLGMFVVWVGYRLASFFGFDKEHAVSLPKVKQFLITGGESFQKFFSWGSFGIAVLGILVIALFLFGYVSKKKKFEEKLILWWLGLVLAAFLVLGVFYDVHFGILYLPLVLLVGIGISNLKMEGRRLAVGLLVLLAVYNGSFLVKNNFLMRGDGGMTEKNFGDFGPPLREQSLAISRIVEETTGPVELKTSDKVTDSPSELDNYRYLLKYVGSRELGVDGTKVWILPNEPDVVKPFGTVTYEFDSLLVSIERK
jgi:4-amino-4-deoxy-L-arabinose transferase-like glycosyltransferase